MTADAARRDAGPYITGVGSVPFAEPAAAVRHAFAAYDLPFFPQLLGRESGRLAPMLAELLTPAMTRSATHGDEAGLCAALAAATLIPAAAAAQLEAQAGHAAFMTQIRGAQAVKTQLAGPLTVSALAAAAIGASAPSPALSTEAWRWCEAITDAWVRALRGRTTGPLTVVWDDALLALHGTAADAARFAAARRRLAGSGVQLGLHTCAPASIAGLSAAFPGALLSVDLHVCDLTGAEPQRAARAHIDGGGSFFCGVFDTRPGRFDAARGLQLARLAAPFATAFTGGCGTGLHTEAFERQLATALAEAAWQARTAVQA